MPITINLDGVEPWKGGAVLPAGRHLCRCTDAEEGRSSGGHFEIHLTWEAIGGEHAGGQIQDWVHVTETTYGKVRQVLEACGITFPPGEFTLAAQPFLNTTAELVVREGTKPDGTVKMEVAAYNRPAKASDVPGAKAGEFQHPVAAGNSSGPSPDDPPF